MIMTCRYIGICWCGFREKMEIMVMIVVVGVIMMVVMVKVGCVITDAFLWFFSKQIINAQSYLLSIIYLFILSWPCFKNPTPMKLSSILIIENIPQQQTCAFDKQMHYLPTPPTMLPKQSVHQTVNRPVWWLILANLWQSWQIKRQQIPKLSPLRTGGLVTKYKKHHDDQTRMNALFHLITSF